MKDCLLLDFDGTITRRDTTRYLVRALLSQRPWLAFQIIPYILTIVLSRDGEQLQVAKNACIGVLLKGLDEKRLDRALTDYARFVDPLLRLELIDRIVEKVNEEWIVLIVTASADFAARFTFRNYPVIVIGTRFVKEGGFFTGAVDGVGCHGLNKLQHIREITITFEGDVRFAEAWSDSISDLPMMRMAERRVWVYRERLPTSFQQADPDGEFVRLA
jgi:HAD superfamily phosphoserine phosphatase-like hydrolase